MIRIDHYADSDENTSHTRFHGFQVLIDGSSPQDSFDLDSNATRHAIDRYLDDRERLFADPPAELEGTTVWLVHGLGRLPINLVWEEFHVYFLLAKLRILLTRASQPVECSGGIDPAVSEAVETLCTEFDVEYRSPFEDGSKGTRSGSFHSSIPGTQNLFSRIKPVLEYFRNWLIFLVFGFVRPLVVSLHRRCRKSVDVRFWLHPEEDHTNRLYDVPTELDSRGCRVGFALYDFVAFRAVRQFVWHSVEAVSAACDHESPFPVEWYIDSGDFVRTLLEAPSQSRQFRNAGRQAREQAKSPEYAYLGRQLERTTTGLVVQMLLLERAIEGFAREVEDDTWCHARGVPKLTARLLSLVGEQADVRTVGISPHYHSDTRVSYNFTDPEVHGRGKGTWPDLYAVFEPSSAATLRKQGLASKIVVARDKIEAETAIDEPHIDRWNRSLPLPSPSGSRSDNSRQKVLVILTLPIDNRQIVDAIVSVPDHLPDVEFVFKPHPLVPSGAGLFDDLRNSDVEFEVRDSDSSLADLVESCDVCIAMYSTAAIPALARATPVVWVPLGSPNHVRMDLIDEIGIRADDSRDLADALTRLVRDDHFYQEQAQDCATFAETNLIPDADAPTLADLIEEA